MTQWNTAYGQGQQKIIVDISWSASRGGKSAANERGERGEDEAEWKVKRWGGNEVRSLFPKGLPLDL